MTRLVNINGVWADLVYWPDETGYYVLMPDGRTTELYFAQERAIADARAGKFDATVHA